MHAHAMPGRWGADVPGHFDPRALSQWLAMAGRGGGGHRGRPHRRPYGGHGFGPPFGPGGGFGPRGSRARRGDVRAALLVLLAEEPRNGYGLMQEIEARSNGAWRPSPGSVYPALSQLEDEGLVRAQEGGGRKLFDLTEEGRAYVTEHAVELGTPWEEVGGGESVGELRSLVFGVGGAVMQVVQAGSPEQVAEAAKVLEETRRSLYRILAGDDRGGDDAPPAAA
jgi:DNA-binding PadR family transcriptional regulator